MRWSRAGSFAGVALGLGVLTTPALAKSPAGNIKQPQQASTAQAPNLSEHLSRIGACFCGAWTCPACVRQMELFGKQAAGLVPYVECRMPEQHPMEAASCRESKVRAYPTCLLPDNNDGKGFNQSTNSADGAVLTELWR